MTQRERFRSFPASVTTRRGSPAGTRRFCRLLVEALEPRMALSGFAGPLGAQDFGGLARRHSPLHPGDFQRPVDTQRPAFQAAFPDGGIHENPSRLLRSLAPPIEVRAPVDPPLRSAPPAAPPPNFLAVVSVVPAQFIPSSSASSRTGTAPSRPADNGPSSTLLNTIRAAGILPAPVNLVAPATVVPRASVATRDTDLLNPALKISASQSDSTENSASEVAAGAAPRTPITQTRPATLILAAERDEFASDEAERRRRQLAAADEPTKSHSLVELALDPATPRLPDGLCWIHAAELPAEKCASPRVLNDIARIPLPPIDSRALPAARMSLDDDLVELLAASIGACLQPLAERPSSTSAPGLQLGPVAPITLEANVEHYLTLEIAVFADDPPPLSLQLTLQADPTEQTAAIEP